MARTPKRTSKNPQNDLSRLLRRSAGVFGLREPGIRHLLRTAEVGEWRGDAAHTSSHPILPQIHLVLRGAAVVEVRPSATLFGKPDQPPGILHLVAPGEFFCLPPSPATGVYTVCASSHPDSDGVAQARVATWDARAMRAMVERLTPAGYFTLLQTSWRYLHRTAEEMAVLVSLAVVDRLRFTLENLQRRFARHRADGRLIDLQLRDSFLARLVCAHRCTVNRALRALSARGELCRRGDLVFQPLQPPVTAATALGV